MSAELGTNLLPAIAWSAGGISEGAALINGIGAAPGGLPAHNPPSPPHGYYPAMIPQVPPLFPALDDGHAPAHTQPTAAYVALPGMPQPPHGYFPAKLGPVAPLPPLTIKANPGLWLANLVQSSGPTSHGVGSSTSNNAGGSSSSSDAGGNSSSSDAGGNSSSSAGGGGGTEAQAGEENGTGGVDEAAVYGELPAHTMLYY
ncbi:hypothetical protein BV25DRAFT_1916109 [Artomyces pyxidatus]|uniref:Uncharacterized protein n=1 Tax=Artomyces pyxidatus TaxID=48021 RepID=A0ACB8T1K3_9AGAM|nr:hypothetical protein BV25DRAFT_1916109 [Artomyces pyxidatus]